MVRKPTDERIVHRVPDSSDEQDTAGQSRVHSGDIGEKDELKEDDRAPRHGRAQLSGSVTQALKIPELRRILAHRSETPFQSQGHRPRIAACAHFFPREQTNHVAMPSQRLRWRRFTIPEAAPKPIGPAGAGLWDLSSKVIGRSL